jgi:hypothetical protein
LEEDLEERPYATLRERCDSVEAITWISVSCSTMCRAIARIGTTRKKGRVANERGEFERATWRMMLAEKTAPRGSSSLTSAF